MSDVPPDPPEEPSDPPAKEAAPDDPLSLARQIADSYRNGPAARRRPHRPRAQSPRRTSKEDPSTVSDLLGEVVRAQGWDSRLASQRVFSDWAGIVGPEIAQHSEVVAFSDGILQVKADSTAWATQLKLLAARLVARLNDELGHGSVLRIEVIGPQAPSWKRGSRSIRGARGPRDTYG
ncbi:DUF721 domain-containing protein [Aeromicrobium sp. CF4.19]|uniref:DUF721 domain-containing protein n=1 Tax=Aeromicrobium sp. CF4.19 TaxID=3373082 RepID=UPI003EE58380